MIIRKPYAFLIKNFKKIHIALLVLCIFIYYKTIRLNSFVSEFISLGSYDENLDPISNYVSPILMLSITLSIIGTVALIFLLRHKGKPWKSYLIPAIEYTLLLLVTLWAKSFFNNYDGTTTGMDIRLIRDIVLISILAQLPILLIYLMRIFGVDLNKFNFKMDEEYLEMTEEDRSELEINFNIDYHMFIRGFNRLKRYLKYLYLEHKLICNIVLVILCIILLRKCYLFIFVNNKTYSQGDSYYANGYQIIINNSYYTDKDRTGKTIEKNKAFVILDVSITNYSNSRELNLSNFHILNGVNNFTQTSTTYKQEFSDLGTALDLKQEIKKDATINTILIYKVNKDLNKNKFVLYYQELNGGNSTKLRKIKIKIKDISKITKTIKLTENDALPIKINKTTDKIYFEEAEYNQKTNYVRFVCYSTNECEMQNNEITAKDGYKILEIPFESDQLSGKELIDFSSVYGKIIYKDSEGNKETVDIESTMSSDYNGKILYINVPDEVIQSKSIKLQYIIRNKKYIYDLPIEGADYE